MTKNGRNEVLDLMRGVAAISVVLYHYLYRGWINGDFTEESFGDYDGIFKYGYIGVQFFFVISGYMITRSIYDKTPYEFFRSRVLRLYPAYWVCLTITLAVMIFWGGQAFQVDLLDAILNYTMISKLLGVPFVDGAYWTLIYEIVFYFWFLLGMIFFRRHILGLFVVLMVIGFSMVFFLDFKYISVLFGGAFVSYFLAGMSFYFYSICRDFRYLLVAGLSLLASLYQAYEQAAYKVEVANADLVPVVAVLMVSFIYFIFLMVSGGFLDNIRIKWSSTMAVMSYPIYLLHQNVGYILINNLQAYFHWSIILVVVLSVIIFLSWLVVRYFEVFVYEKLKIGFDRFEVRYALKSK